MMNQKKIVRDLDPYERQMFKMVQERGQMKFGEIIMRLGLSATHGQRVLNSLIDKKLIFHGDGTRYKAL